MLKSFFGGLFAIVMVFVVFAVACSTAFSMVPNFASVGAFTMVSGISPEQAASAGTLAQADAAMSYGQAAKTSAFANLLGAVAVLVVAAGVVVVGASVVLALFKGQSTPEGFS